MTWTQVYMWTGAKRVPEVRWTCCQQKEPVPTARLREKPAAKWDTWCLGNRPNRPHAMLGAARLIFYSIRWWNSHTYTAALGCLWLQVQTGLSLWEIPPVPAGGWCGKGGTAEWKMSVMEDRLHRKDTNNAAESHSIRLQCKSAIYRA